jgi:hypothetical protein
MKPSIALVSVLGTMSLLGIAYAVATVVLGATPWQYLSLLVQKHRTTVPAAYEPWTWADFLALPTLPRAYRAPDWAIVHSYTARAIRLEGYIAETYRWRDGDVHVHLRATPSPHCFPAGPRQAQIVTEVTPASRRGTPGGPRLSSGSSVSSRSGCGCPAGCCMISSMRGRHARGG